MIKNANASPELQMFVCTRTKEDGACCGAKGSMELRDNLKKWVKDQGLNKRVKITASLCLGQCENGIAVCVYPQNEWYTNVHAEQDIEKLKALILDKTKNSNL